MRKYLSLILVLCLVFGLAGESFAAVKVNRGTKVNYHNAIADNNTGDTVAVDTSNNLQVKVMNGSNAGAIDANGNSAVELFNDTNQLTIDADGAAIVKDYVQKVETATADVTLINTAATLYKVIVTPTDATPFYVNIHDGLTVGAAGKVEVEVAAGGSSLVFDVGRMPLATGLTIDVTNSGFVTVIYDD